MLDEFGKTNLGVPIPDEPDGTTEKKSIESMWKKPKKKVRNDHRRSATDLSVRLDIIKRRFGVIL
jgi:hypothetical protein